MSITIVNSVNPDDNPDVAVHFMPCNIGGDGAAEVKKYFEPYITKEGGSISCSFRGYPLNGDVMLTPKDYSFYFLTESKRPLDERADRKFIVNNKIDKIKYWNWDSKPSKNDAITKALGWIDIAEELHSQE